jgi:outer membrane receptor for monomeric catechols
LSLDVLNLFDRKYYDIAYEQDYRASLASPIVPNGVTVHPGESREFRLTLDVQL